jgi:hypothetical protein
LRKQREENAVTLNKEKRLAEITEIKSRREARNEERKKRANHEFDALEVTLDTVDAPELKSVALDKPPKRSSMEELDAGDDDPSKPDGEEIFVDPVRDETLRVVEDMIRWQNPPAATAKAEQAP